MSRAWALLVVVGALAWGCRPDLPGRGCGETDDCFTDEVCVSGTCVSAANLPPPTLVAADAGVGVEDPDAEANGPMDAEASEDGGADATPKVVDAGGDVASDGLAPDAADPDAAPADAAPADGAPDALNGG